MIKLVLTDLDSTLIWTPEHVITPFALDAVRALKAAGVAFAPCTGRIMRDLPWMFAGALDACSTAVTSNGQLVYLDGELIQAVELPHEALLAVRDVLRGVPDAYLVVEYDGEKTAVDVDLDFVLAHPDNFWRVEHALPDVPAETSYKANVRVVGSFERAQEVARILYDAVAPLDFVLPMPGFGHIDITPRSYGKNCGSDALMERLGLAPSEVAVFGDAENDLAVLGHYENSVAVANAVPEAAAAARWHIGPANEDAVAKALLQIADATPKGEMPAFRR